MGSEMFAMMLWLPAGAEPDWTKALAKASELTFEEGCDNPTVAYTSFYFEVEEARRWAREHGKDHDPDHHLHGELRQGIAELKNAVEGRDSELIEFEMYGWRVFLTGTFGDDVTQLGRLIGDLDTLHLIEAAGFNPPHQEIEVVTHSHKHGVDLTAHRPGTADARLVAIARESWTDINHRSDVPDEPPEDDLEAVQIYIDCQPAGSYLGSERLTVGS